MKLNLQALLFIVILGMVLTTSACGGKTALTPIGKTTPTVAIIPSQTSTETAQASATDIGATIPAPVSTAMPGSTQEGSSSANLTNGCTLLKSQDIASLYSSAEVMKPRFTTGMVNQPVFSTQNIPAQELSCVYFAFHMPGSTKGEMLQVTYWLDIPARADVQVWNQAWVQSKEASSLLVTDLGDDAYYNQGKLYMKKGNLYLAVEAIGTKLDTSTVAGVDRQREIEKQMAQDILAKLAASS